jgi:hypothetical protein
LNRITNFHLVRIANFQYHKFLNETYNPKSIKILDSKTEAIFGLVDQCVSNLKPNLNYQEAKNELNEIHFNIENVFSDKSVNSLKVKAVKKIDNKYSSPSNPHPKTNKSEKDPDTYYW